MTVRYDRGRPVVEFMFRGRRVFRRLPGFVTPEQAADLEAKIRKEIFEANDMRDEPPPAEEVELLRRKEDSWQRAASLMLSAGPVTAGPGIYFLCKSGNLVYVGKSRNVILRLSGHFQKDFDSVYMVPVAEDELRATEAFLIRLLRPPLNSHLTGRKRSRAGSVNNLIAA